MALPAAGLGYRLEDDTAAKLRKRTPRRRVEGLARRGGGRAGRGARRIDQLLGVPYKAIIKSREHVVLHGRVSVTSDLHPVNSRRNPGMSRIRLEYWSREVCRWNSRMKAAADETISMATPNVGGRWNLCVD
ncbi:hypothetical protein KM043_011222 [Ampulex compressa]|nr:hypothetical protein KM043_011222 [Ampulex compressa]